MEPPMGELLLDELQPEATAARLEQAFQDARRLQQRLQAMLERRQQERRVRLLKRRDHSPAATTSVAAESATG